MKVFLSELADLKLRDLTFYLENDWGERVKKNFLNKLQNRVNQISKFPEICLQSNVRKGLYKCVVTKQTTFYYRIKFEASEIEIITFFDTRQDPKKLNDDI